MLDSVSLVWWMVRILVLEDIVNEIGWGGEYGWWAVYNVRQV